MHINIEEINRNDFIVSERQLYGKDIFLIVPNKKKHEWKQDELHLRSILLDKNGEIICSSLPKFFNYSEMPEHDQAFHGYLDRGEVRFAEKMDGSLIIRSVIDGHVNFRTRGSHVLSDGFEAPVMKLVSEKYPALLDASLWSDKSLLFEYTAPDNCIVLEYDEPRLTALGYMQFRDDEMPSFVGRPSVVQDIADKTGADPVQFHELPSDIEALRAEVWKWEGKEGIVAWCNEGEMLVKIKAEKYLKIHSLKYNLSEDRIRKIAWFAGLESMDDLRTIFYEKGLDWEAVDFVQDYLTTFLSDKKQVEAEVSEFIRNVEADGIVEMSTRKCQAIALKDLAGSDHRMMALGFKYLDGDEHDIRNLVGAMVLGIPLNAMRTALEDVSPYLPE